MWLIVAESGSGVAACGLLGFLLVVVVSGFRASRLRASVFRDLWFSGCLGFVAHCRGFGGWGFGVAGFRVQGFRWQGFIFFQVSGLCGSLSRFRELGFRGCRLLGSGV